MCDCTRREVEGRSILPLGLIPGLRVEGNRIIWRISVHGILFILSCLNIEPDADTSSNYRFMAASKILGEETAAGSGAGAVASETGKDKGQ